MISQRLNTRFQPGATPVTVDVSEIDFLATLFEAAAVKAPIKAHAALDVVVPRVHAEAVGNAAAFNTASTGELSRNTHYDTSGSLRRIYSTVKQGALLEYGTPTTGAPRKWLTGPAEKGSTALLVLLASKADPW